jgi:hypothetical protein
VSPLLSENNIEVGITIKIIKKKSLNYIIMKKQWLVDVPVLLIFFARPEKTKKVFEEIRKARPSRLYLYQDGARLNRDDDTENVKKCREAVSNIDWECTVFYMYQEQNYGCDPSEFISQKWMFENEEYGIVLEDDDVPSQSFFPFCKELLERYKDDTRIGIICGMNNLGIYNERSKPSYFFSKSGSIWGWATWKRNVDQWDGNYEWLSDEIIINSLKKSLPKHIFKNFKNRADKHKKSGIAHYETILGASIYLQSQLNIIPTYNMISNIGVGENGTHGVSDLRKLPKAIRKVFFMKTYEVEFPLVHPKYITEDKGYEKKLNELMGFYSFRKKILHRIETFLYGIIYK